MAYKINSKTCAIISNGNFTKIIEEDKVLNIKETITSIINSNCYHYGSSLQGRQQGSAYLLGTNYKPPIILNEQENIILIPTHSIRNPNCSWLVLSHILNYYPSAKNYVQIEFTNNQKIDIPVSYSIFDKQLMRATRLESILRGRNNQKYL